MSAVSRHRRCCYLPGMGGMIRWHRRGRLARTGNRAGDGQDQAEGEGRCSVGLHGRTSLQYVSYAIRRIRRVVYDTYYRRPPSVNPSLKPGGVQPMKKSMNRRNPAAQRHDPALMRQADDILATVRTLWKDLLRNPFADAEQSGITGPQITVMACLVTKGPMTLTELSRSLGMSHSTASGIVDRLQHRGLLQRAEDAVDRRRTSIAV